MLTKKMAISSSEEQEKGHKHGTKENVCILDTLSIKLRREARSLTEYIHNNMGVASP